MVSNVAIENLEWAGRGTPSVYLRQCGVFGCGATRANSRSVGNPSFGGYFPLSRDPEVPGIKFTQAGGIDSSIESGYIQIPRAESI